MDRILHLKFSAVNEMGTRWSSPWPLRSWAVTATLFQSLGTTTGLSTRVKRIDLYHVLGAAGAARHGVRAAPARRSGSSLNALPQVVEAGVGHPEGDPSFRGCWRCWRVFPLWSAGRWLISWPRGGICGAQQLGQEQLSRLEFYLAALIRQLREHTGVPTLLVGLPTGPKISHLY